MTTRQTISAIIPAHPARVRNGMLDRAMRSVYYQHRLPDAVHIAIDLDGQGAAATRQRALDAATTEWVAFLDSDDMWREMHLDHLLAHALVTGADFVYSWFELLDPNGMLYGDKDPIFPPTHFSEPFDPENPIETTITTLMRRELAQEIGFKPAVEPGGTNPGANSGEDRRMTLEAVRRGAKISHLVERTWIWHHHGQNTSGLPTKGDARTGAETVPTLATSE